MFRLRKKAVSLMVGYVLLIALAIGLSVGVFFYLKLYLPSENPVCPEDISVTIDEVSCRISGGKSIIDINLTNRGLFTVDTAYIKIGDLDRTFKTLLNNPDDRLSSYCNSFGLDLKPNERYCDSGLTYNFIPNNIQEISVEPLIYVDNEPVLCENAISVKKIQCA